MNHPQPSSSRPDFSRRTEAASVAKYALATAVILVLLGALAVLVIYPLWYLATEHKDVYSWLIIFSLSPLALVFVRRARRALHNGLFAEFCLKATSLAAFILFLCAQAFWAMLQIVLYTLVRSGVPAPAGRLALVLAGGLAAFGFAWVSAFLRRKKIWGKPAYICSWICVRLQAAYWSAVFLYHGFWLPTAVLSVSFLGFYFLMNLSRIKGERKSPPHETIVP